MATWNDQQAFDLEQSYIRSQTSAWTQYSITEQNPTAKGVPFMPQAPEPSACFQKIYAALTAKLTSDKFSYGLKAVAAIERELRRISESDDPKEIDRPLILESLAVLQKLDPALAAQMQNCLRTEASRLPQDYPDRLLKLLDEITAPVV